MAVSTKFSLQLDDQLCRMLNLFCHFYSGESSSEVPVPYRVDSEVASVPVTMYNMRSTTSINYIYLSCL